MRILLTGASGFIGSALVAALLGAGHSLVLAVRDVAGSRRRWPGCDVIGVDFMRDDRVEAWLPRLAGIDAVVNAVGVFRETPAQPFESIHVATPIALFDACRRAGVTRVVQLSALGADDQAATGYHRSKNRADRYLLQLPLVATVLQPSLVFGESGASSRAFLQMAAMPWLPLPGGGRQCVQPVHIDDLAAAVAALLVDPDPPETLAAVGPEPLRLRDYLQCLRRQLGLGALRVLPVPMPLARLAARIAGRFAGSLLTPDALSMLQRGNCADAAPFGARLGRPPRDCADFVAPAARERLRQRLVVAPALAALRISIAVVWIMTGIVSLGVYPVEQSLHLLHRSGVPPALAPAALVSAALLDLLLGVGMLLARRRRWLYHAQIVLILLYTAIITIKLPEFWLHPYAPILKNLPMLAALALLLRLEPDRSPDEHT